MTDTKPHWTADPNRLLLPKDQLTGLDREIERDLRRRDAWCGRVYRAARDAKPWPEGIPHTQMFEDCWLSGLDERAWWIMDGYERRDKARMAELRRQAAEVLVERRKADKARLKIERARRVRRQRRYQTTKRALCWCGRMAAPGPAAWLRRQRRRMR